MTKSLPMNVTGEGGVCRSRDVLMNGSLGTAAGLDFLWREKVQTYDGLDFLSRDIVQRYAPRACAGVAEAAKRGGPNVHFLPVGNLKNISSFLSLQIGNLIRILLTLVNWYCMMVV